MKRRSGSVTLVALKGASQREPVHPQPGVPATPPDPSIREVLRKQGCFLKGQIAENLVERLIDAHGYEILPYGVEKRFPGWLHDSEIDLKSAAYRQIRAAPDFIAKIPGAEGGTKRLVHIEVKFRSNGQVPPKCLERYASFHDSVIVLVHPGGISANFVERLVAGDSFLPAGDLDVLRLNPELVEYFERVIRQMYDWHWEHES